MQIVQSVIKQLAKPGVAMAKLSNLLKGIGVDVESCGQLLLSAPWALRKEESGDAGFVYVCEGGCSLRLDGESENRILRQDDFVFFTRFVGHTLGDSDRTQPVPFSAPAAPKINKLGCTRQYGGGGDVSRIYLGRVNLSAALPVYQTLPRVLTSNSKHVGQANWLRGSIESIVSESAIETNGGVALLNGLARMLLVLAARPHVESGADSKFVSPERNNDRDVDRVLEILHQSPEKAWTIGELAKKVSMSRTALAVKFRDAVGETLFAYLTRYRIDYAKSLLLSNIPTKQICKLVGYHSEAAFVRAFGRINGVTPKEYRKAAVSPGGAITKTRVGIAGVGKGAFVDVVGAPEPSEALKIPTLYCMIVDQELVGLFPNYMDAIKVSKTLVGLKERVVIRPISDGRLSISHWNRAPQVGVSDS